MRNDAMRNVPLPFARGNKALMKGVVEFVARDLALLHGVMLLVSGQGAQCAQAGGTDVDVEGVNPLAPRVLKNAGNGNEMQMPFFPKAHLLYCTVHYSTVLCMYSTVHCTFFCRFFLHLRQVSHSLPHLFHHHRPGHHDSPIIMRPQYVIEHMEEDDPDAPAVFPRWALLEYSHMLTLVGPGSTVHFTSLSTASLESLRNALQSSSTDRAEFELHTASITTLMRERGIALEQVCLLDPKAPLPISVNDAKQTESNPSPFRFFLFGGILGDDPPRDRTASLRQLGFPSRHLGNVQMTTDTALGVTKRVVEDQLRLALPDTEQVELEKGQDKQANGKLEWITHPELRFGRGESVEMPFRYMVDQSRSTADNPEPLMPPGMRELIRNDLNRSFEF